MKSIISEMIVAMTIVFSLSVYGGSDIGIHPIKSISCSGIIDTNGGTRRFEVLVTKNDFRFFMDGNFFQEKRARFYIVPMAGKPIQYSTVTALVGPALSKRTFPAVSRAFSNQRISSRWNEEFDRNCILTAALSKDMTRLNFSLQMAFGSNAVDGKQLRMAGMLNCRDW